MKLDNGQRLDIDLPTTGNSIASGHQVTLSVRPEQIVLARDPTRLSEDAAIVIEAEVPEFAANRIAVGQSATVSIDAAGTSALPGEVIDVGAVVRRQSQYSQAMVRDVTVSLPPEAVAELRPGMSAQLEIVVDRREGALAVPDTALRYREGRPGVMVRGGEWQPVTLGQVAGAGMHIVEDGLRAGQEVAL